MVEPAGGARLRVDGQTMLAFCSNDYLGLASHPALAEAAREATHTFGVGSGGSPLVSARRWKAATHGIEPLRELHAAMQARGASGGIYVATHGQLSDNARLFARDHGIAVLQGDAVAQLLLGKGR